MTDSPLSPTRPITSVPRRGGLSRGTWLVVGLLALGMAMAAGTLSYWTMQGRWLNRLQDQSPADPAGGAQWDQERADTELSQLQEWFNQVASSYGRAEQVSEAVTQLVEQYPRYAPVRTLLGQVLIYQDQHERAYDQFELSLDLDGQQPEVHLLAGTLAFKLDRLDDAARHYLMAVGLKPANSRYRLHLAQVYIRQHQSEQARDELLAALRVDSALHEAYALLADLYAQQNKLSLALPQIQKAIEHTPVGEQPKRLIYIRRKAQLLRRGNRPEEALLVLQSLDSHDRVDSKVMHDMATCWSMLGKPDQAALIYERVAAQAPTRWDLFAKAAHWRIKAGDRNAAVQLLDTVRRLNPRAPEIAQLKEQLR